MPAVPTIQFTQEQARLIVGLTPERLRHWRGQIPYLASKGGKASRFTLADLTGLAVMLELVDKLDVGINKIASGLNHLFEALATTRIQALEEVAAVVGPHTGLLHDRLELNALKLTEPCLIVPCQPLLARMHEQVFPTTSDIQRALALPPVAVKAAS